ncbi:MAG: hypothetical protein H0U76_20245, partial [Ktedonobacteraceae bacterium]|nr:hypothetical protein [Ktedonobacteraceae bacterium]
MNVQNFLRTTVLSLIPLVGALCLSATSACAQNAQSTEPFGAHVQSVVYDGLTQAGWYSFPGQQPKLRFNGNEVRITSGDHSTVLLSRVADASGSAAEVSLMRAPVNT